MRGCTAACCQVTHIGEVNYSSRNIGCIDLGRGKWGGLDHSDRKYNRGEHRRHTKNPCRSSTYYENPARLLTNLADVFLYHTARGPKPCPLNKLSVVAVQLPFFGFVIIPKYPPSVWVTTQCVLDQQSVCFFHHDEPFFGFEDTSAEAAPQHCLYNLSGTVAQQVDCFLSRGLRFPPKYVQVSTESSL